MQRILVIRGGAIGDFVLTLPAIKLLRDAFPQARLEIVGYRHIVALAENRFYAQATRSIESGSLAAFFARGGELDGELCAYFSSFDLVVSYLFDPDRIFQHNVQRCGECLFIACPPKPIAGEHAAIQLARPLEQLGLTLRDQTARLFPSADDHEFARTFLSGESSSAIAVHPGSGSTAKNWPIHKWTELLETLRPERLLIIGGEADESELSALQRALTMPGVRYAVNLSLPQLAAIVARCSLFLGHDSGISHIAAAVGTPCVLLFGPTDPDVWAPANSHVRALRPASKSLSHVPVTDVEQAADIVVYDSLTTRSSRASEDGEGSHDIARA